MPAVLGIAAPGDDFYDERRVHSSATFLCIRRLSINEVGGDMHGLDLGPFLM